MSSKKGTGNSHSGRKLKKLLEEDGNLELVAGGAIGAAGIGTSAAAACAGGLCTAGIILAGTCPACLIFAPAFIGIGAYKKYMHSSKPKKKPKGKH